MQDSSSRGLASALGWALGCGFCGALVQGLIPAEAAGLRLASAAGILGLTAFIGLRRVVPGLRWVVLAVVAGCVYGSISDLVQPPGWLFVVGVVLAAIGLSLRQFTVSGGADRRRLESRREGLEARAAAYRRAVRGHVSS